MRSAFRRGPDFFAAVAREIHSILENGETIYSAGQRWVVVLESLAQATNTGICTTVGIRPPKERLITPRKVRAGPRATLANCANWAELALPQHASPHRGTTHIMTMPIIHRTARRHSGPLGM